MHATRHSCAVIVVVAIALYADAVVRRWLSFYDTLTPACAVQLAFSWSAVEDGHVVCRATDTEQLYTVQPDFLQRLAALPSIPRIVHISWKNSSAPPQGVFGRLCGAVPLMSGSPGWRVRLYNDTDIANYLRAVLPARDARLVLQRHVVEQVDLWRLLVILHEGGVYMDADRWVTVPLDRVVPPRALSECAPRRPCDAAGSPVSRRRLPVSRRPTRAADPSRAASAAGRRGPGLLRWGDDGLRWRRLVPPRSGGRPRAPRSAPSPDTKRGCGRARLRRVRDVQSE